MTIRDRIIRLFVDDHTPRGTRELLASASLRGEDSHSVAKACLYLSSMGLLDAKRMDNWRHGKRYVFTPQPLLLRAGTLAVSDATLMKIVMAATRAISGKEIRYAMNSLCDRQVTKAEITRALNVLEIEGKLKRDGNSQKYPMYLVPSDPVPWCRLALVTYAWAAGRGSGARGPRPARRGRITRGSREAVS